MVSARNLPFILNLRSYSYDTKITLLIPTFKVVVIKYSENQTKILDYSAFSKAKVTASYFDSHKTNFTEIDLIPVESKQINTPFIKSVRITKKRNYSY
jgi:hypothetical protein